MAKKKVKRKRWSTTGPNKNYDGWCVLDEQGQLTLHSIAPRKKDAWAFGDERIVRVRLVVVDKMEKAK